MISKLLIYIKLPKYYFSFNTLPVMYSVHLLFVLFLMLAGLLRLRLPRILLLLSQLLLPLLLSRLNAAAARDVATAVSPTV